MPLKSLRFQSRTLFILLFLAPLAVLFGTRPAEAVSIDWVTVGNPGNLADTTGFGAVAYSYKISKYEVTNGQYVEFLNAVAAENPHSLYEQSLMGGAITQSGLSGNYTYATVSGRANEPVTGANWGASLRFANWLHNGQPQSVSPFDPSTTEDGAYLLLAMAPGLRKTGAQVFVPNDDEWYKAAYFNGTSFLDYPTAGPTTCAAPGSTPNTANCNNQAPGSTDRGAYTASAGPYGTFDQGGNVSEWSETIHGTVNDPFLAYRWGGAYDGSAADLVAGAPPLLDPRFGSASSGFRVAAIPEPSTALLLGLGLLSVAACRRHSPLNPQQRPRHGARIGI